MKNSLRIHKWTHNEFNIFILGVLTHPHWCELIFILCVQVVQNLQNRMKLVRTFFVPKNEITKK